VERHYDVATALCRREKEDEAAAGLRTTGCVLVAVKKNASTQRGGYSCEDAGA
jgi:hypothetical protein